MRLYTPVLAMLFALRGVALHGSCQKGDKSLWVVFMAGHF